MNVNCQKDKDDKDETFKLTDVEGRGQAETVKEDLEESDKENEDLEDVPTLCQMARELKGQLSRQSRRGLTDHSSSCICFVLPETYIYP